MSRIGRLPVKLNAGVSVTLNDNLVTVKGPLGTLSQAIENSKIQVEIGEKELLVKRLSEQKEVKAAHGLYRTLINNMATGVEKGFEKALILNGVGYKATKQGDKVVLNVGYSQPVEIIPPKGITLDVPAPTEVVVKGISKELVGQMAADIKVVRKPEPFHGYGIRYKTETILRKEIEKGGKGKK
jgi:large subunit ribosomal protein L6